MKNVYPISIQSGMSQSGSHVLMLHEPQSGMQVPIIIGQYEAQSILLARDGVKTTRPMTHELIMNMMQAYGLKLLQVTVDRLVDGVFYSTLHVADEYNTHRFDSRTSDAIALALLYNAPILMDEDVLHAAGMPRSANETSDLERLQAELRSCEESEDYERAAEIQARIESLKHKES